MNPRNIWIGIFAVLTTTGAMVGMGQAQKETPPPAGPAKEFRMPVRSTAALSNGMRFTTVPYGQVPKVAVQVAVLTGTIDEGTEDISLASVAADMLLEGTSSRTAQQISQQAAAMGGSVYVNTDTSMTTIGGEVMVYACFSKGGIRSPSARFTDPPRPNVVHGLPSRASTAKSWDCAVPTKIRRRHGASVPADSSSHIETPRLAKSP